MNVPIAMAERNAEDTGSPRAIPSPRIIVFPVITDAKIPNLRRLRASMKPAVNARPATNTPLAFADWVLKSLTTVRD
jgi:hypothetical protein